MFIIFNIQAQEDNSVYFDDGINYDSKNQFEVELLRIYHGEFNLHYTRYIGEKFSINIGAGKQLSYYNNDVFIVSDKFSELENTASIKGGYNYSISPRFNVYKSSVYSYYFGYLYKYRNYTYNQSTVKTIFHEHLYTTGIIYNFTRNYILDLSTSAGAVNIKENSLNTLSVWFEFQLKLGIKF